MAPYFEEHGKWTGENALNETSSKKPGLDKNKITSFLTIIEEKISAAKSLSTKHYYAKITLLYDALRSILEILALQKGYILQTNHKTNKK